MRTALIERAAEMLARREAVTTRSLTDGTGASTMAVYTHFGGMPGLWRAVRQEGFTRLIDRMTAVPRSPDPVADLVALAAAYTDNALTNPALYRAMFDAQAELDDPEAAAAGFRMLADAAERCRAEGRVAESTDATALATRYWAAGHGLILLVLTGVLDREVLLREAPQTALALLSAAGDERERCTESIRRGWSASSAAGS